MCGFSCELVLCARFFVPFLMTQCFSYDTSKVLYFLAVCDRFLEPCMWVRIVVALPISLTTLGRTTTGVLCSRIIDRRKPTVCVIKIRNVSALQNYY